MFNYCVDILTIFNLAHVFTDRFIISISNYHYQNVLVVGMVQGSFRACLRIGQGWTRDIFKNQICMKWLTLADNCLSCQIQLVAANKVVI